MLVRGMRVLGQRVLGQRVLGMRILGMRVLGVPVPGRRMPARGPCRPYVPLLGAAAALLVVAAGSPSAGQASQAGVTAATAAKSVPAQPASPVTFGPGDGGAAGQSGAPSPRKLLSADVLVVSHDPLPAGVVAKVRGLRGVRAAESVEAARVRVNGAVAAVLGVDPSAFRRFVARPTASRSALWQNVADGAIAVSYTMGRQAKLPAGSLVKVAGRQLETLRVGGLGTVGIAGVDAVVSRTVARSLGFPAGNAIVLSAHRAGLSALKSRIKAVVPRKAAVELLVAPAVHVKAGNPRTAGTPAATRGLLSPAQRTAFLRAAVSRVGMPYVWGAAGPTSFDCSGLVQWSLARRCGHAAGRRRPGAHGAGRAGQPAAARRPALLPHRSDSSQLHLARGDLPRQGDDDPGAGTRHGRADRPGGAGQRVRWRGRRITGGGGRGRGQPPGLAREPRPGPSVIPSLGPGRMPRCGAGGDRRSAGV
jgi:hypothetical protein